jgi:hypothetical protein
MSKQWQNLYMRVNLADTGSYPRRPLQTSPDVIDWGTKPAEDPAELITEKAWAQYEGGRVVPEEANHLYVRGRNLSAKAVRDAEVRLYCAPPSLIPWPATPDRKGWADHPLKTGEGEATQLVSVRAMDLWVAPEAFVLDAPSDEGHSLVGWVSSPTARNKIPDTENVLELAEYLREHPDTAMFHLQPPPQRPEPGAAWETALNYYQGAVGLELLFEVKVVHGRRGDTVELGSTTPAGDQPSPPISATWPIQLDDETFYFRSHIPSGWNAQLTLRYGPNEADPGIPAGLAVEITALAIVDAQDPLAGDPEISGAVLAQIPAGFTVVEVGSLRYTPEATAVPGR